MDLSLVNECHITGKELPSPDGVTRYAVDLRLVSITADHLHQKSQTFRLPEQMARELVGALSQLLGQRHGPQSSSRH